MNWEKQKQTVKINNMWAIINTGGSTNLRHQHGNSTISGVIMLELLKIVVILYFMTQDLLQSTHPNINESNFLNAQINSINPKEGNLFYFLVIWIIQ